MKTANIEVAWAAGLLEGEACFDIRKSNALVRDPDNKHCRIIVEMKDLDVLEKLQKIFGGTLVQVNCKSKIKAQWSPYFKWLLTKRIDVLSCLKQILPMMSTRRAIKIQEMILFLETKLENK